MGVGVIRVTTPETPQPRPQRAELVDKWSDRIILDTTWALGHHGVPAGVWGLCVRTWVVC